MIRLVLFAVLAGLRWQLDQAPGALSYWIRPYDCHLDARCWRWRRPPCLTLILNERSR